MINKQGLLFLTLTSLILVLSVYYITMPNELLLSTNNSSYTNNDKKTSGKETNTVVDIKESSTLDVLRNILNDERMKLTKELNDKLVNGDLSLEEKNGVYEELKYITKIESLEEVLEQKIKEEFSLNSLVKISDDVMEITISSNKHDASLVAKIIASVEEELDSKMYISVSFKE